MLSWATAGEGRGGGIVSVDWGDYKGRGWRSVCPCTRNRHLAPTGAFGDLSERGLSPPQVALVDWVTMAKVISGGSCELGVGVVRRCGIRGSDRQQGKRTQIRACSTQRRGIKGAKPLQV